MVAAVTPQEKSDELQMMLMREALSVAALAVVMLLLHPRVNMWVPQQVWRLRKLAGRREAAEEQAVAELRRDISRFEHGEAGAL